MNNKTTSSAFDRESYQFWMSIDLNDVGFGGYLLPSIRELKQLSPVSSAVVIPLYIASFTCLVSLPLICVPCTVTNQASINRL